MVQNQPEWFIINRKFTELLSMNVEVVESFTVKPVSVKGLIEFICKCSVVTGGLNAIFTQLYLFWS